MIKEQLRQVDEAASTSSRYGKTKSSPYSTSVMKRWKVEGAFPQSKTHSIELVQAKWGGDGSFLCLPQQLVSDNKPLLDLSWKIFFILQDVIKVLNSRNWISIWYCLCVESPVIATWS
ncbi:hypothetical protein TNCV_4831851 [Trichonephila clavipes]|nr:hypothetical protein TNCV_4831851 [Trichonephila clavipes]